jgi:hypothetical protein
VHQTLFRAGPQAPSALTAANEEVHAAARGAEAPRIPADGLRAMPRAGAGLHRAGSRVMMWRGRRDRAGFQERYRRDRNGRPLDDTDAGEGMTRIEP